MTIHRFAAPTALTLAVLSCLGSLTNAQAEETYPDTLGRLPMKAPEFEAFVHKLARQANGDQAAMAAKLRPLGFSCTTGSRSGPFECVKFGCQKGTMGVGSLLQWTVDNASSANGKPVFTGSAINYRWHQRCIPQSGIEEAQQAFLSRHGHR